jgi:hypothetical protein
MRALIWKEFRENLKWGVIPPLLMFVPMVFLGAPGTPPAGMELALFHMVAILFGGALGFLQVFFESRGDKRSLLMHRPISHSQIFLGKVIGGLGVYLLALGVPALGLAVWCATPGHIYAPFRWGLLVPWLADILAGVVYYFAGMLTAQREARWYGSRCLGLSAAVLGTVFAVGMPEFWHALLALAALGAALGVAAWGSFVAGGAYAPQPRVAKAALAMTCLAGLFFAGFAVKVQVGHWLEPSVSYGTMVDRRGRVLTTESKNGESLVRVLPGREGEAPHELHGKRLDRNTLSELEAPFTHASWHRHRSFRNPGRFFVWYLDDTQGRNDFWWYVPDGGRVVGYEEDHKSFLGSYGPDGFAGPDQPPGERFQGDLSYMTRNWEAFPVHYLAFPRTAYTIDFSRRQVRTLYTAAEGETVVWAGRWKDPREKEYLPFVTTDRAVHFFTEAGAPVVSLPRACDYERFILWQVVRLEEPRRFLLCYGLPWSDEVGEGEPTAQYVEYDMAGRELARWTPPRRPSEEPPSARALFGLVTPGTEVGALVGSLRHMRSEARASRDQARWILLDLSEEWIPEYIPGTERRVGASRDLIPAYATLVVLSSVASAVVCFLLARRYAFSGARRAGWALMGLLFGWLGLVTMLAVQEWPARVRCPTCGRDRRVDRDQCEHCGAAHAPPAADGTEIVEPTTGAHATVTNRVFETATVDGDGRA